MSTEVKGSPKLILGVATPQDYYSNAQGIVTYLGKHKPENFIETLFLLDLYTISCPVKCERNPDKITENFSRLDSTTGIVIEPLLKDTRGILLLDYYCLISKVPPGINVNLIAYHRVIASVY